MQQWNVRDVMTKQVPTVRDDATPTELVETITAYDVSALAVVDDFDLVIGVVTRTDVLKSLTLRQVRRRSWPNPARRTLSSSLGWDPRTAREMMSAPALTVGPDATLAEAGRLMHYHNVNRLLVTTGPDRRLLGIVTAADLLKRYARSDEDIRADVRRALEALSVAGV
jgi:CBS domain-containing protein